MIYPRQNSYNNRSQQIDIIAETYFFLYHIIACEKIKYY